MLDTGLSIQCESPPKLYSIIITNLQVKKLGLIKVKCPRVLAKMEALVEALHFLAQPKEG